jgi:hypothetical protein
MNQPQVINTLATKRNEIRQHIRKLERDLETARRDLSAITESMRIFSPDGNNLTAYMNFSLLFKRRELPELCRAAMAAAGEPVSTQDIATYVMEQKGMDTGDRHLRKAVTYKCVQILRRWERLGEISRTGKRGAVVIWQQV